jgi:hypothetical protein
MVPFKHGLPASLLRNSVATSRGKFSERRGLFADRIFLFIDQLRGFEKLAIIATI